MAGFAGGTCCDSSASNGETWTSKSRDRTMDVSKNNGTAKWMVKIMETPIKMDDLGVPLFLETPMCVCVCDFFVLR